MAVTINGDNIVTSATTAEGFKVINPGGGRYAWTSNSTPANHFKIVFPFGPSDVNTNDYEWFKMKITAGSPYFGDLREIYISANLSDSTFSFTVDEAFMIDGTQTYETIIMWAAVNSTNYELYIDYTQNDWAMGRNPIVHIDEIWVNGSTTTADDWKDGWSISMTSTLPTQKSLVFIPNQWAYKSSSTNQASGYSQLANGMIMQWKTQSATAADQTVTFPLTFPNNCWGVWASMNYSSYTSSSYLDYVRSITTSGCVVENAVAGTLYVWAVGN